MNLCCSAYYSYEFPRSYSNPAILSGCIGSEYWCSSSKGFILESTCLNLVDWNSRNGVTTSSTCNYSLANLINALSPLNLIFLITWSIIDYQRMSICALKSSFILKFSIEFCLRFSSLNKSIASAYWSSCRHSSISSNKFSHYSASLLSASSFSLSVVLFEISMPERF